MKKSLFIIIAALMAAIGAKADLTADWKLYMPFDDWASQVIETPTKVYFTSRTFEYNKNLQGRDFSSNSLFYYDKQGDEIISVNERVNSNGNAVATIAYNASKKYLLVVYADCNIDFFYDDGRVFNVSALKSASIPGKKSVNNITFDPSRSRAYIGTTFGYLSLNDDRHEVAESRNYGEDVQSIARVGSNIVLCSGGAIYYAPTTEQRYGLEDYKLLEGTPETAYIFPLGSSDNFVGFKFDESDINLYSYLPEQDRFESEKIGSDNKVICVQNAVDAIRICGNVVVWEVNSAGKIRDYAQKNKEDYTMPATSLNGSDLWVLVSRKGLRSYKIGDHSWELTMTRDYMRPNAPATYVSSAMAYHPEYGLLCGSNSQDIGFSLINQKTPANISALKNGFWKEYGFFYSGNSSFNDLINYGGVAIDPQNRNHIYRGSTVGGIMRVDLSNPSNILIMANPSNGQSGKDGFIKIVDDLAAWNMMCRFTVPQFSTDGTMWSLYDNEDEGRAELWYWPAADRLATTSAANYRPMKKINVPSFPASSNDVMITLTKNKNIIAIGGMEDYGHLLFYDHNGTPDNTSDDRYVHMTNLVDQDGGGVTFLAINNLFEDPETGLVYIMTQRGLFTVNPATAFEDPTRVNRIKVARNDGTNLADYLLNEICVNSVSIDGEGRKWFSTANGLVCTSADGRSILGEFTTDNSYLPSDAIVTTCYNPENDSMMVATSSGLVEMFPSGSGNSSTADGSGLRAYPNPVEPDYYGWVRIDNITDGSLVKITDSKGGIVKELGPVQGGSVEWDVSGLNNSRVTTGVYYIMVSPGSNGDGKTQISKILVLN